MNALRAEPRKRPEAWLGRDMAESTEWIVSVPPRAVAEMDAALRELQRRGLAWPRFGREDFPLPTFSRDLSAVLDELENGRGFVVLRGFAVDHYSLEELRNLYWGVGAHLGHARYQNAHGELIGEVRDEYRLYGEVQERQADPALGRTSRSKARSSGPPALPHRSVRRGHPALRPVGAPGRGEQDRERGERRRGHSRSASRSP